MKKKMNTTDHLAGIVNEHPSWYYENGVFYDGPNVPGSLMKTIDTEAFKRAIPKQ